jgi:hypothetical protein
VRRGASWTAAWHLQLTVAAVAGPVPVVPLLRGPGGWPPRRRLPGGASSRRPASGVVAVAGKARTPAVASVAGPRPPCVHAAVASSGSGGPAVRCPAVRCPAGCCPPRPSGRVISSHLRRRWGPGRGGGQPSPQDGSSPGGLPQRGAARWTAEPARTRAMLPRSRWSVGSVANPGRVGDGGRPRLTGCATRQARPACGAPSRWRRGGHGSRRPRQGAAAAAWLPSSGWVGGHGGGGRGPAARLGGSGGAGGRAGGAGCAAQRGPGWRRAFPARCRQRCDLREWLVGRPGLEPGTSSLSGIEGSALCGTPFPQVTAQRRGRRDAFKRLDPKCRQVRLR